MNPNWFEIGARHVKSFYSQEVRVAVKEFDNVCTVLSKQLESIQGWEGEQV